MTNNTARLYEYTKCFSVRLTFADMLPHIVELAASTDGVQGVVVVLIDPDSGEPSLRARWQAGMQATEIVKLPVDQALIEPVVANPDGVELAPSAFISGSADELLLGIPLMIDDRAVGVLGINGGTEFDRQNVDQLINLSRQMAVSIQNVFDYEQAVNRIVETQLLAEAIQAISSSLELRDVLSTFASYVRRSLDVNWCSVLAYNPEDAHYLRRLAEYHQVLWPRGQGPLVDLEIIPLRRVLFTEGRPFSLNEANFENHGDSQDYLNQSGFRRMLSIPLKDSGDVIGMVELADIHLETPYTAQQIETCFLLAHRLAAVLIEDPESEWEGALHDGSRNLLLASGADRCTLSIWDGEAAYRLFDYGRIIWLEETGPLQIFEAWPTMQIVLDEQRITEMHPNNATIHPQERQLFEQTGLGAMLALPLVSKARAVGLVQLYDLDPDRTFSQQEIQRAYALANQAAIALDNARLFQDLRHSLDQLEDLQNNLIRIERFSALGELSAAIAHQINNPLTTILGDAEMLVEDIAPDNWHHESASAILRAGQQAKKVVEQVLNMVEAEDERCAVSISETLEAAIDLVDHQIKERGIAIRSEFAPDLQPVQAIPILIKNLWVNLLVNAFDAVEPGAGLVTILTRAVDGGVEVSITDNGYGIPPESLPRIFDSSFTTKPHGQGTGLGLYICKQIVENLDGTITVDSVLGEGARVVVFLPTRK